MAKKKNKKPKKLSSDLPVHFLERIETIVGPSLFREVRETFHDRPTTFRINTILGKKDEIMATLREEGFRVDRVEWYKDAFILRNKSKRELTDLPMYTEGKIYIQSLASMVPPLVLDPQPGEKILDLTAAPGSKTSQMAALMGKKGELIANDLNKVRFFRLKANMEMLGVVETTPHPSSQRRGLDDWTFTLRMEDGSVLSKEYAGYFDKVLVDAPCSGESRFVEGYPKSYGYWNEKKIKRLAFRQHKLIMAAWTTLKPGGVLVYSTCTIAPEENEMRISKLLERVGDEAKVESIQTFDGLKTLTPILKWKEREIHPDVKKTLRILPTKDIEGFFVAKVRKKEV